MPQSKGHICETTTTKIIRFSRLHLKRFDFVISSLLFKRTQFQPFQNISFSAGNWRRRNFKTVGI